MRAVKAFVVLYSIVVLIGCWHMRTSTALSVTERDQAIATLRSAYAAFNRGDIDAAVAGLDPEINWVEPAEFPGGGTYHGREGVKQYLTQSRAGAADVISEPVQFIPAENRIVVFVHARVRAKGSSDWQEVDLADIYTIENSKIVAMHAFSKREDSLQWARMKSSK